MKIIKEKAYSKINIGLEVLYKRNDGFHEINTIFARTCLADDLIFEHAESISIASYPPFGFDKNENLIFKAAILLQEASHATKGAKITVKKKIPMGGGLGGGSSNAASALIGLQKLWGLDIPESELLNIAIKLGSDVPFFLKEGIAVGKGRGETLDYYEFALPWPVLIVNPGIHISTAAAYSSLKCKSKKCGGSDLLLSLKNGMKDIAKLKDTIKNDFEEYVFSVHPEMAIIKNTLYGSGAVFALMSGSGSSLFGFFDSNESLEMACGKLSNYSIYPCYIRT